MGIKIRCLAHASFQIKTEDGRIVYIDPSTKHTGLNKKDFEPADMILVTHAHEDHFDKKLLKDIRKLGSPIIAPPNLKKEIKGVAWDLSPGQFMKMATSDETIWATEAYNVKRVRPNGEPFHPKGFGVGYLVKFGQKRIYHAGDTDLIPEMENLADVDVDVALLPAGDTYTMDLDEAAEAALMIKPKVAIPMHLKGADPAIFKEKIESQSDIKVVFLGEGEEYTLE